MWSWYLSMVMLIIWNLTCPNGIESLPVKAPDFIAILPIFINCFSKVSSSASILSFGFRWITNTIQCRHIQYKNIKRMECIFQSHAIRAHAIWKRNGISIVQLLFWNKWVFILRLIEFIYLFIYIYCTCKNLNPVLLWTPHIHFFC